MGSVGCNWTFQNCHGQFNWLHPKTLPKLSNIHKHKIRELLEINNLEKKAAEYDKSIEVLNRGHIVKTNSWKPLFHKINMVHHTNAVKYMLLRVNVNYIIYINTCVEPQKKQLVGYCSNEMVGSYVISHRT